MPKYLMMGFGEQVGCDPLATAVRDASRAREVGLNRRSAAGTLGRLPDSALTGGAANLISGADER